MLVERAAVPQPGIPHTSSARDKAAGPAWDTLRRHGHFSCTLFADRETQPRWVHVGTGLASFLIIKASHLGFCFKTILP